MPFAGFWDSRFVSDEGKSVGFLEEGKEPYATTHCRGVCLSDQRRGARRRVFGRSGSKGLVDCAKGRLVAFTMIPRSKYLDALKVYIL